MISVKVDSKQAEELLTEALKNVGDNLDTNRILDKAGASLLHRIRTRFLAELDPDNVPWIPSKAGLRRRARGSTGTLFKTGNLFHSIQLHTVGDLERKISTDVWYARHHQDGTGGHLMRKFLGFNDEDQTVFTAIVQNELVTLVKEEMAKIGGK